MNTSLTPLSLHPERLLSGAPDVTKVALELYEGIKDLPIVSPHGHTDPRWFSENKNFENAADLLIKPDHYVFRMLYSQGIFLEELGIPQHGIHKSIEQNPPQPEIIWQLFADHYYLFAGTPSGYWLDSTFSGVFGFKEKLCSGNAQEYYQEINRQLVTPEFAPRALLDKFNIELIATTEGALDSLKHHRAIQDTQWAKRVITTFRPDDVVDAEREDFRENVSKLADLTGEDTSTWKGYLAAVQQRRAFFKEAGRATATDHGHPTAKTADLSLAECEALFERCRNGGASAEDAELFRAQMLTELAGMSVEDGLVMQIHPGAHRNHNKPIFDVYGRDKGADIPTSTEYVNAVEAIAWQIR